MPGHRKRRQFKQTDAFTRGMVIGLKRAGWSIRQIAADTHLGASTVHRLWRRWLEQGNVAIYRNVGATRVTSARVDRRILRQAVEAPQATCTAILQHVQDTLDHSISTRTISRRLVANGLHSCRPLRRLPLTPPNRRQRLEWCRARSTWMTEWHRVVLSDESRFCLSSDSRRVRVWRRRGERCNPVAIVERPTVRQRGIMVWSAIAYDSRSPLFRIQGTMTAQRYVDDVLRPVTLPYLQGVPNVLYQQDNARLHTARISQQALQDVQMLPWPPYSPDLSPIEHVWDIIGRRLHALPQPRSEDELWQMVEREWRAIPQDAIRTLIDSLPRRVAACIALCRLPPRLHGRVDIEVRLASGNTGPRGPKISQTPTVPKSRQDSGRQGTSKQVDHCLYRKMEQGREEDPKEPMKTDPDYESGEHTTFPKKENTLGRTQEIVPSQEDVTPSPPVSDVLGRLTTTLHQLSAVTGHRERWNRYDGSYEAQSFFTNYDAQADQAQLQYSTRLRKPANLLQAPLRVNNMRAYVTCSPDHLYTTSPAQTMNSDLPKNPPSTAQDQDCPDIQDNTTALTITSLVSEEPSRSAEQVPERPSTGSQPGEELSPKKGIIENSSLEFSMEYRTHASPPAREGHGTLAAARGDVTAPPTAASSSENLADPASLNWADSEMAEVDANDDYTVVKSKKRRLSSTPEHAAKQASRPAEKRGPQQQKRTTGPRSMPPQEIKATRANIADARARQATTNHENYVFVELCPDIPDYSYLKAMSTLLGGPKSITQFHRMNGHFIVGLADKELANRLVADGLEIEGTSLRVFPFRKRAERIVVANLPGFVEDSTITTALGQFGKVTSIAPILVKMGEFTFTDGRREAFILLREGVRLETLPTRPPQSQLPSARQARERQPQASSVSHRRKAPPLPPPQRPRKPAPAPATPASPVQPAKTSAEAQAIPSAHQPAEQMDLTHPAPAADPAPLAALRPPEPRIPPLDNEMAVEKLSSPPATPARGKAALEQLLEHLGKSPNPSIDWDKLPDLNCEEAQKLLTSETTMKRRAPTLTKEQFTALEKLHETIKALCPDSNSTIRKTLQKTRKETNAFHLGSGQDLCLGYGAVVLAHPVAISGSGLACVFGPGVAVLQQRILWPGHIALATIDVHGEEMTAIAVHLAHEPRERNQQLELLAATAAQEEEGACWIIGDFNIRDRGPSSSSSSDALAHLLDLVDVATQFDAAHLPTRVSMHGDQVESNRLDRILVPAGVLDRVSIYATSHYHLSDHRLVLLQVGPPTTAVSSPTQPRLAAMLRSGLALEHLAGYIRELEEDTAHDDDDGTFWDRWTSIKAGLLAEARSLHDPRHAANDSYVYRARRYIAAQLEASSIRADYPSLPDLARAIRLRRPVSVIRDEQDNIIEGPELRRRAFATFQPRFARPTSDPATGAAFIASSAPTTTRELSEEDPLHRRDRQRYRAPPSRKGPRLEWLAVRAPRRLQRGLLRGSSGPGVRSITAPRPVALPSADYRVLAAILHRRLKPHLRTLVPECQTYAVPGRSPSWNIAMVTDAIEEATALGSPLAVMGVDLESAFDSLDRGFLESLLTSLRLPPAFMAWINILYAGADATIRVEGFHTTAFPLLNGLRQGCAVSAALFSIATGPLLRRLELTLGVGNVIAYADDIVLLFHRDGDFERVATVFEDYRQASGIGVNLRKSAGLWCGAWRNRGDSPLGASWSTTSIRVLGLDIAPRSTVIHREQHLLALLETACRKWTPFTRGLSLVGRARAANTLVGSVIQHHLHGYLPSPPTIAKLQARLARFVWGQDHTAWLPADVMARPVAIGGLGLLDLATQLQLACLKGPRRLRLLKLWEEASNILGLNHRAVPTAQLLDLPIIGGCRFLRPPDLLATARWSGARVRDLIEEEHLIARPTRSALADAAALGAFCRRLTSENAVGFGAESTPSSSSLAAAVVLRGTATPFLNGLTTRSARRALDRPRLAATPISRFLARWTPTINPPSRIDWASLRRCAYSGHEADAALKLALHALPHPAHPASVGPSCPACGSIDRSLGHRYWCCRSIRPLIREAFNIIGRPPDLQAWIFGGSGLEDDVLSILASAKLRIYRYFVQVGLGEAVEDPLIAWSRTLQRRGVKMPKGVSNVTLAESPERAAREPERPSSKSQTSAELSAKITFQKNSSEENQESSRLANLPAGKEYANPAAARDVTTGSAAATSSNDAARVLGNWADCTEDQGPGKDDDFTVIKNKKRRRVSPGSPAAAAPSSGTRGAGATRQPRSSTGWAPRAEEVRTTRAHIAEARARQASSTEDHCVFVERSPELEPYHYMRAIDRMFGSTRDVFQVTKMNGHFLVGMASRGMAERLVNEGLEVEGTLHRAFPFRKRAERITVGNLPFFVGDAAVISALSVFGRVTSIAPKLMKAGPYVYNDGRREAFIILREGMTIERLPTRLDISIKGEAWPAYLSSGIRCSSHGGLRRASREPSSAPSTCCTPVITTSAFGLTCGGDATSPSTCDTCFALAGTWGFREPSIGEVAALCTDIEMTTIEESSASSTASSRKSTREDLVTLIRKSPTVSFAETDALGLGREEILDLLSPKTRAQRQGPLLTPPQNEALAGMIKRLLGLKPGSNTSVYKVLRQVKSVLRTGPAAVPPTPTLTAPRPAKPTPPVPQRKESAPTRAASLLALPIKTDEDRKRWLRDTFKELDHRNILRPILEWIDEDSIINSVLCHEDAWNYFHNIPRDQRNLLAGFLDTVIGRARGGDQTTLDGLFKFRAAL
ncbi:hypothetical protein LAZ67_1004446 [Cordylochernes scorpioides]|uniref:Reverse transcriptase domain-containing protein n=1 Tax=Cordylochernes scorpioides TaxID=51811 RepID=A0ABY6K0D3_9ARAC|nr:hypothetical protein LAZ67_1004446 [Cordylochernes scorpioides]